MTALSERPVGAQVVVAPVAAGTQIQLLLVLGLLVACSDAENALVETKREGEPTVYGVRAEDQEMNAAMEQARSTIGQFRERLMSPPSTQTYASLKVRFGSGDSVEHIWIDEVELVEEQFRGRIANEPIEASTPALGQSVTVSVEQVSDWMVVDSSRLIGGYTLRVLRDRMSPDQRAEFDASLEFRVD